MYGIVLHRNADTPISVQLAQGLRTAIHSGTLGAGTLLLSGRRLAEELGVSRRLVAEVYDQLASEGYLVAREGSGTRVAPGLSAPQTTSNRPGPGSEAPPPPAVQYDFSPGIPDLGAFPRRAWLRAGDEALSFASPRDLSYGSLQGEAPLREAVASYLHRVRGLRVDPGQIVLTSGTAQSLLLLALMPRTGALYHEDPGPGFASGAFAETGWPLVPLAVDGDGADPEALGPTMVGRSFVSLNPSHQFPTGALMPVGRRLRFLERAGASDSYLIEDDYDSEFRLEGNPVPPLYSLDPDRVVYLGSFSKSLAPFLRIGYALLPPRLAGEFLRICRAVNARTPGPTQLTLARFLESGQLERHVYRQRKEYRRRQDLILEFLASRWGEVEIRGREMGSHLYLRFPRRRFSPEFFTRCRADGLRVVGAEAFYRDPTRGYGDLVLGYGNLPTGRVPAALERLARHVEAEFSNQPPS